MKQLRLDSLGPLLARVAVGLAFALAVHAILRPFVRAEMRDYVAMVPLFAVMLLKSDTSGSVFGRTEWLDRTTAAIGGAVIFTLAWKALGHLLRTI